MALYTEALAEAMFDALVAAEVVLVPEPEAVDPEPEDPELAVREVVGAAEVVVVVVLCAGVGVLFLWCFFFFLGRGGVGDPDAVGVVEAESETNSEDPLELVWRLAVVEEDDPVEDVDVEALCAVFS